jgi:hypothetical protein
MKKADLIDLLQDIPDDAQVVICTQKRHTLYGDIGSIEPSSLSGEEPEMSDDIRDVNPDVVYVLHFTNEGYSPAQALNLESINVSASAKKLLGKLLSENVGTAAELADACENAAQRCAGLVSRQESFPRQHTICRFLASAHADLVKAAEVIELDLNDQKTEIDHGEERFRRWS